MKADIKYKLDLWTTRSSLQDKGIHRPITEMVRRGWIKRSVKNYDYLSGRIICKKFLKKLMDLDKEL